MPPNLESMREKSRREFEKAFKVMAVERYKRGKYSEKIARVLDIATDRVRCWCREKAVTGEGICARSVLLFPV